MGNSSPDAYGYRILKVAPDSPSQKAGLIEFFDFIVGIKINNQTIEFNEELDNFFSIISEN